MIAGGLLISVNNAILKSIPTSVPLGEVICLRALVSLALIAGFVLLRGASATSASPGTGSICCVDSSRSPACSCSSAP